MVEGDRLRTYNMEAFCIPIVVDEGHVPGSEGVSKCGRSGRGNRLSRIQLNRSQPTGSEKAASLVVDKIMKMWRDKRLIIGIVGAPGSGKTTTSRDIKKRLQSKGLNCVPLPMDGFHFYRNQLDLFENPVQAHKRRGAPFTFDAERFISVLSTIRQANGPVFAPDFDHRKKDPREDAICIDEAAEVVIVEGNYLLLEEHPWTKVRPLLDASVFLDVDLETSMRRVVNRHVEQLGLSREDALNRVNSNDRPNALRLRNRRGRSLLRVVDLVI
uniref:AAA+ ATPase domain-containing protein n=1 Tax=Rhodosorus marinus TaxID=101924 RepID=A0A7S3EIM3_9RHOD|mmetsp:Transcript_3915/g.16739  ORF Transcript_3915/g.16739 Transcript_3915/m.16739 type:complete len:271 (+) Transcript_3915:28-840(+)